MLNQKDIDILQQRIQAGEQPELYFVAHNVETREGFIDEAQYKLISKFKVLKIKITEISNAYFEYLDFKQHPENYHIEEETEIYDYDKEYIHKFVVKNGPKSYTKDLNPRIPSIIYGMVRTDDNGNTYEDPSPVKEIYTNYLEYGDYNSGEVDKAYKAKKLDWKYLTLDNTEVVDGISYKYVTSDWYVIKCLNFPRTEHILINVKQNTAYFLDKVKALDFVIECES